MSLHRYKNQLQKLYERYNHQTYLSPDPLECVYGYSKPSDQEIVGLIAATLAFGNVKQILRNLKQVLERLPEPTHQIKESSKTTLQREFHTWRHRYVNEEDLVRLLSGIGTVTRKYGSLEACFKSHINKNDKTILPALSHFITELRANNDGKRNYLLTSPIDGSACKRMNLYLRWMVRHDAIDPGIWAGISPAMLVIPVDTHMYRIACTLGATQRRQANLRTALEITEAFRQIEPEDPTRYDFALTRAGIRNEPAILEHFS